MPVKSSAPICGHVREHGLPQGRPALRASTTNGGKVATGGSEAASPMPDYLISCLTGSGALSPSLTDLRKPLMAPPRSEPRLRRRLVPNSMTTISRMIRSCQMLIPIISFTPWKFHCRSMTRVVMLVIVPFLHVLHGFVPHVPHLPHVPHARKSLQHCLIELLE